MFAIGLELHMFMGLPLMAIGVLSIATSVATTFITAGLMVAEWWESWPKFRHWLEKDD